MATDPDVRRHLRRLRVKRRLEGPRLDLKPRLRAPTTLQKIFKQRNQKRSTYYLTTGRQLPKIRDEDAADDKPFWYPPAEHFPSFLAYHKQKRKEDRRKEEALPVDLKMTARMRHSRGLLVRLHVPDDPALYKRPEDILDMDPEFFTIVEGRPNRDRVSIRDYVDHIRELLRVRLKIGYNEDECILVDEQFRVEKNKLDKIVAQHKQYVDAFEQFLADDHESSMELLKKADMAAIASAEKDAEMKHWIRNLGLTRTQVYMLEEKWKLVRLYQRFLYLVSPMNWRREYDYVNGAVALETSEEGSTTIADTLDVEYEASEGKITGISTTTLQRANSLQEIIDTFIEDTKAGHEPQLYFTEPAQLIKVFRTLAAQSLASLMNIEHLRLPLEALLAGVAEAEKRVQEELRYLEEQVADLEREIEWEENRVKSLRSHTDDVIAVLYRDLMMGDTNVLAMHVWVEDIYEKCVAQKDSHLSPFQMMTALERVVAQELLELDYLDREHVERARKQVYSGQERQMKEAYEAQRELQHMERLVHSMERALEPPPQTKRRQLVFRSRPPEPKQPPPPPPVELSEEELDHIAFFTETESGDPLRNFFPPELEGLLATSANK